MSLSQRINAFKRINIFFKSNLDAGADSSMIRLLYICDNCTIISGSGSETGSFSSFSSDTSRSSSPRGLWQSLLEFKVYSRMKVLLMPGYRTPGLKTNPQVKLNLTNIFIHIIEIREIKKIFPFFKYCCFGLFCVILCVCWM